MMSGELPAAISVFRIVDACVLSTISYWMYTSFCEALYFVMNACSGPIWAGWVPAPRPMNQRTTVPPFGPGPCAIGADEAMSGVALGTGVAAAAALGVAAAADAAGAFDWVVPPHAATTTAMTASNAVINLGPDLDCCIAISPPRCEIEAISSSRGLSGWAPSRRLRRPPVAGRLRAKAS